MKITSHNFYGIQAEVVQATTYQFWDIAKLENGIWQIHFTSYIHIYITCIL